MPPGGGAQNVAVVRPATGPDVKPHRSSGLMSATAGAGPSGDWTLTEGELGHALTEQKLVARVFERCNSVICAACQSSSVPPEFLGALTANESGANDHAMRFEPAVYRHLVAVVSGGEPAYGSIKAEVLLAKLGRVLHPKADDFHAHFLTPAFGSNHAAALTALPDEGLRELATSWGYTQIMGYHMVERHGEVRDLLQPAFHFRVALELLAEFAAAHQLNHTGEFAEMFCCWNTGQPYGKTYDPMYVENGLSRMAIYKKLLAAGEQ
ncbi:MAG: hypothetical protein ACYDA9_05155 [Terriglobia bacterium]